MNKNIKDIRIAFFDIDGTLLPLGRRELSEKTTYALNKLQENGIMICIATGRSVPTIPEFQEVKFDVFLTFNGSLCFNERESILRNPLKHEDVVKILENTKRMNRAISLSNEHLIVKNGSYPDLDKYFEIGGVTVETVDNIDELCRGDVFQMMVGCTEDEHAAILEGTSATRATAWWDRAADLIPMNGGKGEAIRRILDYYRIPAENAIAFGDGHNDVEMFRNVGVSVAMGNANDDVKEAADHVCGPSDEDGIYYFCAEHDLL